MFGHVSAIPGARMVDGLIDTISRKRMKWSGKIIET
jgi:hypothetical protein